ncbi:MAG: leucine-rich repeat domain-containing protein [Clostridia bacterium]|nr:leucine-rich repeat domain-containing protein [Clostridia bacterium]
MSLNSSFTSIAQELIKQKTILENKGVVVSTQNPNPSPSEITDALNNMNINIDTSVATAVPEDVRKGKSFYSQYNEIQTGTLDLSIIDDLQSKLLCFITGTGTMEIEIPTDEKFTKIREYAFNSGTSNKTLFYKENLTIPSNITRIGVRAFYMANLTGKLVVPETCTYIENTAFQYTNLTEAEVFNGMNDSSTYILSYCPKLKKVTLHAPIKSLASYSFAQNPLMEEIYLPSTLETMAASSFYKDTALKLVQFTGEEPSALYTGTFSDCKTAAFLVPYQSYNTYFNATNYQYYGNPMYGYGEFSTGQALPSADDDGLYTITWHSTLEDAQNVANAITVCPADGKLFAVFTAVETATETETETDTTT